MRRRILFASLLLTLIFVGLLAPAGWSFFKPNPPGAALSAAAAELLATFDDTQRAKAVMAYNAPQRVGWHFIPKKSRKGLQLGEMREDQRRVADRMLRAALSEAGYTKARGVIGLEGLLAELERDRSGGPVRDPLRYYVTLFGEPGSAGRWGLSFEGHHLSLNFVVEEGRVVSSTPQFLAANPGTVQTANEAGFEKGFRLLKQEELLGFELVNSLDARQKGVALIAEKAPREIRAAGEPHPPRDAPAGIAAAELDDAQRATLRKLIAEYAGAMPAPVAADRLAAIDEAGREKVHFAWAGATREGVGHYYRVQGPTFLIELVNTQPDAAGNPANHVHCVWRDMRGDFGLTAGRQ